MGWLARWWRQSDHYDRLSSHLQAWGLATVARFTIALIAAGLSVDALGTIWTPTGPRGVVPLACTLAASVGAAVGALLWVLRWPTRAAATAFAVLSTASIALIALAQHNPRTALGVLDRYRAQFPEGRLASEAVVLRVQALVALGDRAGAQALADAYSAANPGTPYARRLREIVQGQ